MIRSTFLLLLAPLIGVTQTRLNGLVTDTKGQPLAYVAVGVPGTPYGTLTDEAGKYSLEVRNEKPADSLKFAAIGYLTRTMPLSEANRNNGGTVRLAPSSAVQLKEVVVKGGKPRYTILGNKRYNKNVFCSFTGMDGHYKGTEAAIRAGNKKKRMVRLMEFNFCILKNTSADSVPFRLNFYEPDELGMPGKNTLKRPVYFKTTEKNGVVTVNLLPHDIFIEGDFFISLECLREDMGSDHLNFSGSVIGPAYFKAAAFSNWERLGLMGLDFNVKVEYRK